MLSLPLGGNLVRFKVHALIVKATVEEFPLVVLAFTWAQEKYAPLILGHMHFFLAFVVCFYISESAFKISQKRLTKEK